MQLLIVLMDKSRKYKKNQLSIAINVIKDML